MSLCQITRGYVTIFWHKKLRCLTNRNGYVSLSDSEMKMEQTMSCGLDVTSGSGLIHEHWQCQYRQIEAANMRLPLFSSTWITLW